VPFLALGEKDGKLHYATRQPGRATVELLPEIFEEALKRMDQLVPKRMRWGEGGSLVAAGHQPPERRVADGAAGDSAENQGAATEGHPAASRGEHTFVRPVQWLLVLFGEEVVPLQRFGLTAARITYGHRFHAPAAIELRTPADYAPALRAARVEVDFAHRRDAIRSGVEAEAARHGGTARITGELLNEVTALVEWPVVISGRIEDRFLQLPPEVIVATVETNQRYFTVFSGAPSVEGQVRSASGYLKPAFITVANIESRDVAQIIAGNERVVRPRLADALFFWEQDRRQRLEDYAAKFAQVTYQRELGTLAARVDRLQDLARTLAERLGADAPAAQRAAALCKCDLGTAMVGEFPELQGLMGGYYARADGEPAAVAEAIREHYLPTQQDTPVPATPLGRIVALADKLDLLAGYFAIGQKPTATKDPYGLRRAALGIVRILVEGGLGSI
jgi:Glycyl-tRNA synthetase, beta subunit